MPAKHKPHKPEVINLLSHITSGTPDQIVSNLVLATGHKGCLLRDLLLMANLPQKQLDQILQTAASKQQIIQIDKEQRRYIHQDALVEVQAQVKAHLADFHQNSPLKSGVPKEELKTKLPVRIHAKLFQLAVHRMIKEKIILQEEDIIRLANHTITLGADQEDLRNQILSTYQKSGLMPPYFKDLCQQLDTSDDQAKQVLSLLVDEALLVKIKEDLYYDNQQIEALKKELIDFLLTHGEISTPQFKEMTGASRKFVIPLIEYFDLLQVTIRVGDIRKLRKQPGE